MPGAVSRRDARIDALKGFAILCVVTYHALGQYYSFTPSSGVVYFTWAVYFRAFLFSFMLPLFAFLSGYVLGREGGFRPERYFRSRTLGLLVPYIVWEAIYGPSKQAELFTSASGVATYFIRIFTNPHLEGRMWYLYVLWIALMILGVARLRGDRTWVIVASIPLVFALGSLGQFNWLRWIYIYVAGGVLYRRYESSILPRLRVWGWVGALAFAPLWLLVEPPEIAAARIAAWIPTGPWNTTAQVLLVVIPVLVGACGVIAIIAASYRLPARVERALAYLGVLSLGIYVTHFPFVEMWKGMPGWFLPINVAIATGLAVGCTLLLGRFRPTAAVLLGEPWVSRPRQLGDVATETL
ncbi:MAG: acyltransferase [Coriobacteriia bacterium]|nr:acyltransferase [Coriobacteriia bacterium]